MKSNRKKIIAAILITIFLFLGLLMYLNHLYGVFSNADKREPSLTTNAQEKSYPCNDYFECFEVIKSKDYLSYDKETHIIYYLIKQQESASGYRGFGYTYFAPYISENGKFCKYIDDKIVEIDNTAQNTNN